MSVSQAGTFNVQEFTDAGIPLALGRLYTYANGTTTQKIAYTDAAGLVPHTYTLDASDVPYIALNGRGELPAPLYLLADGPYDLALKRPDGSSVWTRRAEGVASASSISLYAGSGGSALVGFLQGGTGAVARTAQDKMQERVCVFDFMTAAQIADVRSGTRLLDVTACIQAAINYAIYTAAAPKVVYLPYGQYKTSDVLSVGYGVNQFATLVIEGEVMYAADNLTKKSGIYPTFNDRPAINLQGCRNVRLRDFAVVGVNYDWLRTNYSSITDRSVVANWYGPNISASNNTQNAPYVGICVDAYAGTLPGTPYPAVTYPSFLGGGIAQYNKSFSSQTTLENVSVMGFVVGVCVQPGNVPDGSNGDFVTMRDCDIQYNVVDYADGHSDARNPNLYNCRLAHAHTSIDSLTYGNQHGNMAVNANGCSFESVFRILNINLGGHTVQGGYSALLASCYGEDLMSIGNAYTGFGGKPGGLAITETKFAFTIRSTEFSPVYTYNAPATTLTLRNVHFNGAFGFHQLNANVIADQITIDKLQDDAFNTTAAQANRVAKSFTCGIFAPNAVRMRITPAQFLSYGGANLSTVLSALDSENFDIALDTVSAPGAGTGFPIPWFVRRLMAGDARMPVSGVAPLVLDRTLYNLSSVSLTGSNYTFTSPNDFITDAVGSNVDAVMFVGKGDIAVDSVTGHVYAVTAIAFSGTGPGTTMTATMRQLNNVQRTGALAFAAGGSLSTNTGTLTFYNARRVYPSPYRVNFTATAASGAVTHAICGDETAVNFMLMPVAVNDYLITSKRAQSPVESVFPAFSKVTASNVNTGAVTLNKNARRSFYGDTPLYVKVL